jgi:tRNA(Ile)-lysidine synthase
MLSEAKGDLRAVDFEHVEAVLDLARRHSGEGEVHVPGLAVERSFDWLRAAPLEPVPPPFRVPLAVPGTTVVPGATLVAEITENQGAVLNAGCRYNGEVSCLDWGQASGCLEVRSWQPGDQYQPAGRPAVEKLKVLFQKSRVPSWERHSWPLVVRGEEVLWTRRFGPAASCAASPAAARLLVIRDDERFWNRRSEGGV